MGTTPNYSWPYPESSDYVADGATAIENLADAIDTTVGGLESTVDSITEWTSFTPSWTNLTVGNATQDWRYTYLNKLLIITGYIQLGSTSSVALAPYFTFPTGSSATTSYGTAVMLDSGTAERQGTCFVINGFNRLQFGVYTVAGSLINRSNVSATYPHTWTTNDLLGATLVTSIA